MPWAQEVRVLKAKVTMSVKTSSPHVGAAFALVVAVVAGLIGLALSPGGLAQETRLPTADEVKALQAKFRKERDGLVQGGAAKRFLPVLMDKAEDFGKRADAALASG